MARARIARLRRNADSLPHPATDSASDSGPGTDFKPTPEPDTTQVPETFSALDPDQISNLESTSDPEPVSVAESDSVPEQPAIMAPEPAPNNPSEAGKGRLLVETVPADADIKIMNIRERYRAGIELSLGSTYDLFVTKDGFESWRRWVRLTDPDQIVTVELIKSATPSSIVGSDRPASETGRFIVSGLAAGSQFCVYVDDEWDCNGDRELRVGQEYHLFASAPGYQNWRGEYRLERINQPVTITLQRVSDTVVVNPESDTGSEQADFEPEMVLIPGGCYQMGSPEEEEGRDNNELQTRVCVDEVYAGKYEVTFAQYDVFAKETGRKLPDDEGWGRGSRPVINVKSKDAREYTKWLGRKTGKGYRIPTEAEWEYAARGGSENAYPWGNSVGGNEANCWGCGDKWKRTAPVGSFNANRFGLYDTSGNVMEWTCSEYARRYDGREQRCSGDHNTRRSLRGGSWSNKAVSIRSAFRYRSPTDGPFVTTGFRVFQDTK